MFGRRLSCAFDRLAIATARRATERRLAQGKVHSLWGATPIVTLPLKAAADRLLGFRSQSLVFMTYYIRRDFDINLRRPLGAVRKLAPRLSPLAERIVLAWAMRNYDVFHLFFDRGLLQPEARFGIRLEELDLLRASGKRVYLYAYGADVRTRERTLDYGRWNFCVDCPEPGAYCVCDDVAGKRHMVAMCERVTASIALGDMLAYVPNVRKLHYWPIDIDRIGVAPPPRDTGALKIAHAPNHTHFKGSIYLEGLIEQLRAEGHAIEYVKVQGVPNSEVIRLFGEADIIADQFIGGMYGYTALEAMARGKPVLTYVRSRDWVEAPDECPVINATPDTLEQVLRWLLANRAQLPAIGAQGRAYVERHHSIDAVAGRLAALYVETANFPPSVVDRLKNFRASEARRLAMTPTNSNWVHPWIVS